MLRKQPVVRGASVFLLITLTACDVPQGSAFWDEPKLPAAAVESQVASTQQPATDDRPANRLSKETSPYLLLHAHNPVDWYPWGPDAFARAKAENKPIFLSIGYSSCYWCHVMERQVFENETIAAYMNEHFVNIKVDREERPEIDDLYMLGLQVYLQATGSSEGGGWPLSMFLTPTGKPFAGGTYFPPEDLPGRPGFPGVLRQVQGLWSTRQKDLEKNGEFLAREVQRLSQPGLNLAPARLEPSLVVGVVAAVTAAYDTEYGGFDFNPEAPIGPKFPSPTRLMLVQSQIDAADERGLGKMLDHTLQSMAAGGIRDHLAGGYHRYSVDRFWRVPHFEKMLYDNAQLAETYAAAWRRTNRDLYREIAETTYAFIADELTDPRGGFYSALDAETDGIEGKYYVWSREEVAAALGADDAKLFGTVYGLDQEEYFEHGYVLHLPRPLPESADRLQMPQADLDSRLVEMRGTLLTARRQRPPLVRDDKILTNWNGLMIQSLARGGALLQQPEYIAAAEKAALFVLSELRDDEGRLLHTYRAGQARLNAYLDDYAFLVGGLLALHDATGKSEWLNAARRLTDEQVALFRDERGHGFFYTAKDHEPLLARAKEAYDSVMPSGNGQSVRNLVRLALLTGETGYRDRARETLRVFAPRLRETPGSMCSMAQGLSEYLQAFGPEEEATGEQIAAAAPPKGETASAEEKLTPAAEMSKEDAAKHDKLSATAYLSVDRLPAGGTCRIALVIDIDEGWHINANPAQPDYLVATELTVTSGKKTKLASVEYPKGETFKVEGIEESLSVYEGRCVIYGTLEVPKEAAGQTEQLELTVRYQTCNDKTCLRPAKLALRAQVPVAMAGGEVKKVNESLFKPKPAKP
jgi:uncharacterized protein YyaL (SSP411 family)